MKPTAEERHKSMRKVPDAVTEWAKGLFKDKGNIYYKRKGRHAYFFCSVCGSRYEGVTKVSEDITGFAEHYVDTPVHGETDVCEKCGKRLTLRAAGRGKKLYETYNDFIMGQKQGKDFVFRAFRIYQYRQADKVTNYVTEEYARVFLEKGKKPQKDYFLYSYYEGYKWCSHNIGGMCNIGIKGRENVYPGTYNEIDKTEMFKYIPRVTIGNDIIDYYSAAARYQDFEMVVKLQLDPIMRRMMMGGCGLNLNPRGKTVADRLRIYPTRCKDLIEYGGNIGTLETFQYERKTGNHWTIEEMNAVYLTRRTCSWNEADWKTAQRIIINYSTPVKLANYITKHEKEKNWLFSTYLDYIRMRIRLGYDMTDEVILYPKDMRRRHNEMVMQIESEEEAKRIKEVEGKYKNITKNYKKLMDKYGAAAGGYIIRPAKSAKEIVIEGRTLHHCVGASDKYMKEHNDGESYILFLRPIEQKDIPYITIQIKDTRILQWYGEYDKKTGGEMMQKWLDTYIQELKKHEKAKTKTKETKATVKTA